ncbi:conserved protein of unknown function [Rhodovastum atsumiense]|uniref:DUF3574 domain-containing protein n=1 Tax=Rhodovastum atsumiense TaxID=504468 RepID=A0A5M6J267_9PROT|nr:DUF3574 domain-containing protein [Rhodovastum atsumiense]KAA5614177.1 DUF3574 domain-containing protein [Rhodovastum atsumiense]CAH2599034.1 conserved protein of unknown function [Rhodovastum atsumiense]
MTGLRPRHGGNHPRPGERGRGAVPAMVLAAAAWLCLAGGCTAPDPGVACAGMAGRPQAIVTLYFGRGTPDRPITDESWRQFLAGTVTPRFPDGLTVLDGHGQWRQPATGRIISERSSVVTIVTDPDAETMRRIEEIRTTYRSRFDQDSVGLTVSRGCASF